MLSLYLFVLFSSSYKYEQKVMDTHEDDICYIVHPSELVVMSPLHHSDDATFYYSFVK